MTNWLRIPLLSHMAVPRSASRASAFWALLRGAWLEVTGGQVGGTQLLCRCARGPLASSGFHSPRRATWCPKYTVQPTRAPRAPFSPPFPLRFSPPDGSLQPEGFHCDTGEDGVVG